MMRNHREITEKSWRNITEKSWRSHGDEETDDDDDDDDDDDIQVSNRLPCLLDGSLPADRRRFLARSLHKYYSQMMSDHENATRWGNKPQLIRTLLILYHTITRYIILYPFISEFELWQMPTKLPRGKSSLSSCIGKSKFENKVVAKIGCFKIPRLLIFTIISC